MTTTATVIALPMRDARIERAFVASLIHGHPDHHGVDLTHLSDPNAAAAYEALCNQRATGLPVTVDTVRARLELEGLRKATLRPGERVDLEWYDAMTRTPTPPGSPIAGWAATVLRFAARRALAIAAEDAAEREQDEITDIALRDAEPLPEPTAEDYERLSAAATDFARNDKGVAYHSQANIALALAKLGVSVRYDRFGSRVTVDGLDGFGPELTDAGLNRLRLAIDAQFGIRIAKEFFADVIQDRAHSRSWHPVLEHLAALPRWDGTPRVDRWLTLYGGAEDTPYVSAVGRMFLVAAVRRVREPGCIYQELLILESPQGKNKSTALAVLAGSREWFADEYPIGQDTRRFIEATSGRWIVEAGELKGMGRGDVAALKAGLSRTHDEARLAYGRHVTKIPRQHVPIGTTNDTGDYLRDSTGNRRFLPVAIREFDLTLLRRDRDQLWAEACALEAAGVSIRLDPSLYEAAAEEQAEREVDDSLDVGLCEIFSGITGRVRVADVMRTTGVEGRPLTCDEMTRMGVAMRKLGWTKARKRVGGGVKEYFYVRGNPREAERRLTVIGIGQDAVLRPE